MELIIVSRRGLRRRDVSFGIALLTSAFLLLSAVVGGAFYLGYRSAPLVADIESDLHVAAWREEAFTQRQRVEAAVRDAKRNLDALAARVGELQARVMRVDALGARLVDMAKLDAEEFGFDGTVGRGGPQPSGAVSMTVPDFIGSLETLATELEDRAPKLRVLETALMERKLDKELIPSGRPVMKGWISSLFGNRADPFSGKRAFHSGLDFAGRSGSDIVAAASGVVVWSGPKKGYGTMVEIDHGNGYRTLYAHNRRNLVKVGDTVRKGDIIALMGASGRATGTHVHFEVLRNGDPVNPLDYVRAGG